MPPARSLGTADTPDVRLDRQITRWVPAVATAVLLVGFLGFFKAFIHTAMTHPYAGHLPFVPLFAAVLVWIRHRDVWRLRLLPHRNAPAGAAIVTVALAVGGVAYVTANVPLQTVSFVAALTGLLLWFFGGRAVRELRFVLVFLMLMTPPPRELVSAISPAVQHFVAVFSFVVLRAVQIPVEQHGVFLYLPGLTLEVAEECAGLRFLPILFVFVAAFARAVLPTAGGQATLIALSIPAAVLANAGRVAATGAAAYVIGPDIATGAAHYYIGKGFWVLALLTMIGIACVLRARVRRELADVCPRRLIVAEP